MRRDSFGGFDVINFTITSCTRVKTRYCCQRVLDLGGRRERNHYPDQLSDRSQVSWCVQRFYFTTEMQVNKSFLNTKTTRLVQLERFQGNINLSFYNERDCIIFTYLRDTSMRVSWLCSQHKGHDAEVTFSWRTLQMFVNHIHHVSITFCLEILLILVT